MMVRVKGSSGADGPGMASALRVRQLSNQLDNCGLDQKGWAASCCTDGLLEGINYVWWIHV
jgi:hypothetical protein